MQELEQVGLALGLEPLQFREGDFGLVPLGGGQAEHRLGRPLGGVVEQALVDVADLLDVECPEAQPAGLAVHFEVLERPEQVQHRPVVDRQRGSELLERILPRRPRPAAFEEREPVGVEQLAGIGQQLEPLVPHPAVDRPEGREQPHPGIVPPLQHLLAVLVGGFLELGHEGRDGVVLVVERVAQEQQAPLLGREQKHQPHHDRQGGFVQVGLGDARQQFAASRPDRSGRASG